MEKKIMLGNEAIARGAWEAGVKVSSAYPGTPSTEMSENLVKYEGVYAEWAPNEKVAAEVAMGASIAGVRAMCAMKCVGLNVASDPLYTASYIGAKGGLVYLVADDPGLYSSQNEQDTRRIGISSHVPVIEPSDSEEARVFTKRAFEISEEYDTPVILRTTTRIAHSQGVVNLEDRVEVADKEYTRDPAKNVMVPANAMKRHKFVIERDRKLSEDGSTEKFADINKVVYTDKTYPVLVNGSIEEKKVGFITSGIPYQYVKEVFPEASVLKLGMVSPTAWVRMYSLLMESTVRICSVRRYLDRILIFQILQMFLFVHQFFALDVLTELHTAYLRSLRFMQVVISDVIHLV